MKKAMYLLIALMMLFLCTCSKDEGFLSDSSRQDDLLKKTQTKGAVFTVSPNGVNDTQTIIDAFDNAKAAGHGSVVQLAEGLFKISFIEIRDFYGYFKGAGKDKTKVMNLDVMPPTGDYFANNCAPFLVSFVGGDVNVSKMTFATTDGKIVPDDLFYGFLESLLNFADYTGQYVPPHRFVKGVVEDVDFIGGNFEGTNSLGTDHNVGMSVYIGSNIWTYGPDHPYGSIDVTIRNCVFDHVAIGPDCFLLGENSVIVMENIATKRVSYDLWVGGSHGCKVIIRGNQFYDSPQGTYFDDGDYGYFPSYIPLKKRSEFYISGNYFERESESTILSLFDNRRIQYPDEGSPQLFDIKGNTFITQEGGIAIYGFNNVDAKIWNNKFTGTGSFGVWIDGDATTGTWAENNSLIGNNFFDATYTDATVYLGPYSMKCKVVGVASDQVVDDGTNNSVIGTKAQKKGVQSGQYLQNNSRNAHEKLMRRGRL